MDGESESESNKLGYCFFSFRGMGIYRIGVRSGRPVI